MERGENASLQNDVHWTQGHVDLYIISIAICISVNNLPLWYGWSEDKKGQDQISESTLNKVNLPANSCSNQTFIEACYRRNLYQIFKPKCSSVKTTHTNDQYQLLTNCPTHSSFTWLTGHKQWAPNLFWHCCHAVLMCHFALTGCTSQSQHITGSWQGWQRSWSGPWSR